MPHQARDRIEVPPYDAQPCPDEAVASSREHHFWRYAEQLELDIREALADHGHTAVATGRRHQATARLDYLMAREARLSAEASAKTKGDVIDRIVATCLAMQPGQRDEVIRRLNEAVRDG